MILFLAATVSSDSIFGSYRKYLRHVIDKPPNEIVRYYRDKSNHFQRTCRKLCYRYARLFVVLHVAISSYVTISSEEYARFI